MKAIGRRVDPQAIEEHALAALHTAERDRDVARSAESFHVNAKCGACGGPLEVTRDAVCQACVPDAEFFREVAAIEKAVQAGAWREIKQALRHARRQLMYAPHDRIAQHLVRALAIFEQCGVHFEETS